MVVSTKLTCILISNGRYPICECKHGPAHDSVTNTRPNLEYSVNESFLSELQMHTRKLSF